MTIDDILHEFDDIIESISRTFNDIDIDINLGIDPKDIDYELAVGPDGNQKFKPKPVDNFRRYGPIIYGFKLSIDDNGQLKIERFGNVPQSLSSSLSDGSMTIIGKNGREPLIDIIEDDDGKTIKVIAEIPGISKDEIELEVNEKEIFISAKAKSSDGRKYVKRIVLDKEIEPEKTTARSENGILEITVVKKEKKKEKAKKKKIKVT